MYTLNAEEGRKIERVDHDLHSALYRLAAKESASRVEMLANRMGQICHRDGHEQRFEGESKRVD